MALAYGIHVTLIAAMDALHVLVCCVIIYLLGLNRCIDVCAEISRQCQHRSAAKTYAIFACLLLACSECHELFNHEASQSKYCDCLSAAGAEAEFMYSACAHANVRQFNSS
jgi:hypothetical protein